MTGDLNPQPIRGKDAEALSTKILSAVERQLARYFSAMSQQADATKKLAEATRDDFRAELDRRLPVLEEAMVAHAEGGAAAPDEAQIERIDALETTLAASLQEFHSVAEERQAGNETFQQALQGALEERLSEFANHQHWRIADLETKLAAATEQRGLDPETMMEVRQAVRDDMERSFGAIHARLDELAVGAKTSDERSLGFATQLDEAAAALQQLIGEGDERSVMLIEDRLATLQVDLNTTFEGVATQVTEHSNTLLAKIEQAESRGVDRLLELETRMGEDLGTKIANLEATIGRIGSGFDDAMIAMNQRLLELENKLYEFDDRMVAMDERVALVDQDAINELRGEMSNAVGEAMLVRIELDRVVASTNEKIEKQTIRMSEIEGLLVDHMDVSTAVQLERLDELERQMLLVEPPKGAVARKSPAEADGYASGEGYTAADETAALNREAPSMLLNPRLDGTDTSSATESDNGSGDGASDETRSSETEPTFSTH